MKPKSTLKVFRTTSSMCALFAFVGMDGALLAGDEPVGSNPVFTPRGAETQMDLPGSHHKYYGQNVTHYRDAERKVAKIDVDGDLNYDGTIDNHDPADNGAFEVTPPGLVVGVGELTKMILRVRPYRIDYQGEVVVTIEVAGINRAVASGKFESFEEEQSSVGRIRVWRDAAKSKLLLDSGNPDMLVHEFIMDKNIYPANLPGTIPRTFYVEGVRSSGAYSGDLRLLTAVTHREPGTTAQTYAEDRKSWLKTFRTSFDHMLFTVTPKPMKKEFINNNAEGVWIAP